MTKAGAPCPVRCVSGKNVCAAHDPETRAKAQRAGGAAKAEEAKAKLLSREEADEVVNLQRRVDVPATIEAIARAVACGELATNVGNAVGVFCNVAIHAHDSIDKASRGRAAEMTDEELDQAIEEEIRERLRRRQAAGGQLA